MSSMRKTVSKVSTGYVTTKDTKSRKGSLYETLDATFVLMRLERFVGGFRPSRSETSAHLDSTSDHNVRKFVSFLRDLRGSSRPVW
jgi:hypothetical protein